MGIMDIEKIGDWNKVDDMIPDLGYRIKHKYHIAAHSQAQSIKDNIIKNIQGQSYGHPALNPKYKAYKVSQGYSSKILIRTGQYINSIEVIRNGDAWEVGVPMNKTYSDGTPIGKVGLMLEYGTSKMTARPHWRVEYTKVMDRIKDRFISELSDLL